MIVNIPFSTVGELTDLVNAVRTVTAGIKTGTGSKKDISSVVRSFEAMDDTTKLAVLLSAWNLAHTLASIEQNKVSDAQLTHTHPYERFSK